MAYIAKDKIVRTGTDVTLATVVNVQSAVGSVAFDRLEKIDKVALTAATGTTGGAVLSWANPEGVPIVVTRVVVVVSTAGPATRTVDFGVAADGTTTSDTLLDGVPVSAAGVFDNIKDAGTNGKAGATMTATQFITGTASGALTNMVANAYIHYVLA